MYLNSSGSYTATNIAYIPTKTYILSVKRQDDGSSDYEFSFSMKNLDDSAAPIQTQITDRGAVLANSGVYSWAFGRASFNFEHVMGPCVFFNGVDVTSNSNAITWLEAQYTGDVEVTNQVVTQTHTYQLFSRKKEEFECKFLTSPLQFLDLSFTDSLGNIVQPVSGLVELEISE